MWQSHMATSGTQTGFISVLDPFRECRSYGSSPAYTFNSYTSYSCFKSLALPGEGVGRFQDMLAFETCRAQKNGLVHLHEVGLLGAHQEFSSASVAFRPGGEGLDDSGA